MSRIPLPADEELDEQAKTLLEQVRDIHGFVPNQHRLDAYFPLVIRSLLDLNRRTILAGDLDPVLLETIALVLALENECEYCIAYHLGVLEDRGFSPDELEVLREDWRDADFIPLRQAYVELAVSVNDDPHTVTDDDIDRLLELGASEQDLVQLLHFVNLMRGYNTFNIVLQTDLDDERGGWLD